VTLKILCLHDQPSTKRWYSLFHCRALFNRFALRPSRWPCQW
jgi:hypothetical protein